jgi:hypothetical protein
MWFTEGSRVASIGTTVPEVTLNSRQVSFGDGSANPRTITVTNTGDAVLHIGTAALTGADKAAFTVVSDGCSKHLVRVQTSCRLQVAFRAGSDSGVRAARLAISDNATASPQIVSLVAQLPDCKLPVFPYNSPTNVRGEFLSVRDGSLVDDPAGDFVSGDLLSHSKATPVLNGQLPAFYDRAAGRWVPTGVGALSPDGRRYAYMDYSHPFDFQLHVVDVATGRDQLLTLSNGPWSVVGFTSDGIYVHQTYEGVGPGLWLVNPDSGAVRKLFSDAAVDLVSGQVAWIEARDSTDPRPEPPGIGGANNEVQSRDLNNGTTTTWFYRSGAGLRVVGAAGGSIMVSGYDWAGSYLWAVNGPGQAVLITTPESGEPLPITSGLVPDANGWWLGSLDGVYLWTARTGAILVSEVTSTPAGTCA